MHGVHGKLCLQSSAQQKHCSQLAHILNVRSSCCFFFYYFFFFPFVSLSSVQSGNHQSHFKDAVLLISRRAHFVSLPVSTEEWSMHINSSGPATCTKSCPMLQIQLLRHTIFAHYLLDHRAGLFHHVSSCRWNNWCDMFGFLNHGFEAPLLVWQHVPVHHCILWVMDRFFFLPSDLVVFHEYS